MAISPIVPNLTPSDWEQLNQFAYLLQDDTTWSALRAQAIELTLGKRFVRELFAAYHMQLTSRPETRVIMLVTTVLDRWRSALTLPGQCNPVNILWWLDYRTAAHLAGLAWMTGKSVPACLRVMPDVWERFRCDQELLIALAVRNAELRGAFTHVPIAN